MDHEVHSKLKYVVRPVKKQVWAQNKSLIFPLVYHVYSTIGKAVLFITDKLKQRKSKVKGPVLYKVRFSCHFGYNADLDAI